MSNYTSGGYTLPGPTYIESFLSYLGSVSMCVMYYIALENSPKKIRALIG